MIDAVISYRVPVLVRYCMVRSAESRLERTKDRLCLLNDGLDMHGQLLSLSSNIAACSCHYKWVGIAIRILKVEAFEEDGRGRDHPLAVGQFLAEL